MSTSYIPYASRPDRNAMDTFRAMVKKDEKSHRSTELTEALIRMNPGHYSIWAYRAQSLLETCADLTKELDLMDELIKEHLKSYQVWQHRRTIVTALQSSTREIAFTTRALSFDAKNYHTWAYRQWVLLHFFTSAPETPAKVAPTNSAKEDETNRDKVWEGEIAYTDELLDLDIRNNSAWNHRFWVAFESGMGGERKEVLDRELRYVKEKLALSPNNPSAWNYLRGILKTTSTPLSSISPFVKPLAQGDRESALPTEPKISELAELPSWQAIEFLADAAADEAEKSNDASKIEESAALFKSLVQFDPIRTNYWLYRADEVEALSNTE